MLQMAMPGVASVADAWRAKDQWDVLPVHVESHPEQHCVPVPPEICALCEFAASCVPQFDAPAAPMVLYATRAQTGAPVEGRFRAVVSVTARPRAPPLS